jgi:uncharacterized protein YkwD
LQASVGYIYTFQPGDTLWDIAAAHGLTVEALIAANRLPDPTLIHPGDWIFVPADRAVLPRKSAALVPPKASPPAQPPQNAPTAAPVTALPAALAGWPAQIMALMNERRTSQGLHALTWSAELAAAAQAHADDCQRRGWGSHVGSDGAITRTRLARAGYAARWSGENWANARSPADAFAMWWNEPRGADPHRSNIMNPMYREAGIGIVTAPWGYYFFVDFGSRQ